MVITSECYEESRVELVHRVVTILEYLHQDHPEWAVDTAIRFRHEFGLAVSPQLIIAITIVDDVLEAISEAAANTLEKGDASCLRTVEVATSVRS